jgi:hypothetical protein
MWMALMNRIGMGNLQYNTYLEINPFKTSYALVAVLVGS